MFLVLVFGLGVFRFFRFYKFFGGFALGVFLFFDFDFWFLFCFLFLFSFSFLRFCDFDCCCILYSTSLSSYVQPDDGHHYGRNM